MWLPGIPHVLTNPAFRLICAHIFKKSYRQVQKLRPKTCKMWIAIPVLHFLDAIRTLVLQVSIHFCDMRQWPRVANQVLTVFFVESLAT
jgi:hypothetical protein